MDILRVFPQIAWRQGSAVRPARILILNCQGLTQAGLPIEDGEQRKMKRLFQFYAISAAVCMCLPLFASQNSAKQKPAAAPSSDSAPPKSAPPDALSRITIEVTGGDKESPVENASVYVKFVEERKIKKDKKFELNVKTNRDGTTHVPNAPMGRVLIQVIAEGWKTYGRWYDITDAKQTIKIHLEKPPKWY
jgi:hypothetical protein